MTEVDVQGGSLLADVLAHPEDRALRRIYGDYLSGMGEPRGELVQVQCDLEETDGTSDPNRPRLRLRENQLLAKHEKTWTAPYGKIGGLAFHGGMVERVHGTPKAVLAGWDALFAREPVMELSTRGTTGAQMTDIAARPGLARLRKLKLAECTPGLPAIRALATSPHVVALRDLDLYQAGFDGLGLAALLSARWFPLLHGLVLSGTRISEESLVKLLERDDLHELRALGLGWLFPRGLGRLVDTLKLPALASLDLSNNPLGGGSLEELARLRGLRAVRLGHTQLSPGDLAAFASMPDLEELDLSTNGIGTAGAERLAVSPFPKLRNLRLMQGQLGADGVAALVKGSFPALEALDLTYNQLAPAGGAALAAASWMPSRIDLWGNRLGDEGVAALARAPWRTSVRELKIGPNALGDAGVVALASVEWPRLESLVLTNNPLGDGAARALDAAAGMPMLSALDLSHTKAPKTSLKTMRKRLGAGLVV